MSIGDVAGTAQDVRRTRVIIALLAVYLSWSSTYLGIKFALESLPPLFMMGMRFFLFGLVIYAWLRLRGEQGPNLREWWWSAVIGTFLMLGGSAGVAYAEQRVSSGLAALVIATTPLWTVLFAAFWKHRPNRVEWAGLAIGFLGIVLLNLGGDLRANPVSAALLALAALCWAFGSAWSQHVPLPRGMMAGAAQMIAGGAVVLIVSFAAGERVTALPTLRSVAAVVYLGIVGSLIGFTAYVYLLGRVRPALATSYAYVNPILALLLGLWIGGEKVGMLEVWAMGIILLGVVLVVLGQRAGRENAGTRERRTGTQGVLLRPMTSEDAAEIRSWPPYGEGFEQMDYAIREKGWLDEFGDRPDTQIYIAEAGHRIIGFSLLSRTADGDAEFRIVLHPRLTGKGYGKDVTDLTLKLGFRNLHLEKVHLIVRKNNPRAERLYRRIGFVATGESTHSIQGKKIEFIEMEMTGERFRKLRSGGDG